MSEPVDPGRAWLEKAAHDFLNIENNLVAADIPWDTVCYHAQQAAEKTLKAFLVARGANLSRGHDLVVLLAACARLEPNLADLEEDCARLNAYSVGVRYPDDVFEPLKTDGIDAHSAARKISARIRALMP